MKSFSETLSEFLNGQFLFEEFWSAGVSEFFKSFRILQKFQNSSKVSEFFSFFSPRVSNRPPGRSSATAALCRRCGSAHRGAAPNAPPGVRQRKAAAGGILLRSVRRRREAGVSYCCRSHKAGCTALAGRSFSSQHRVCRKGILLKEYPAKFQDLGMPYLRNLNEEFASGFLSELQTGYLLYLMNPGEGFLCKSPFSGILFFLQS